MILNKKFTEHLVKIATNKAHRRNDSICQYKAGDTIYVTDGARVIKYAGNIIPDERIEVDEGVWVNRLKKFYDNSVFSVKTEYVGHLLPTKEELRQGIKEIAGKKYSTKVYWSDGIISINARYLLEVMEVLNCEMAYIDKDNPYQAPYAFFYNDDTDTTIVELICPVVNPTRNIGFWKVQ